MTADFIAEPSGSDSHRYTGPAAERPLFTVIVPFLNEERWLATCLAALRAQPIDPALVKWILIDNGSTDRSAEIARAEPRAALLAEARRNPYLARNQGIRAARGRYLFFLDADYLAEPDWLATMYSELQASDAAILLGYLAFASPRSLALQLHEDYQDAISGRCWSVSIPPAGSAMPAICWYERPCSRRSGSLSRCPSWETRSAPTVSRMSLLAESRSRPA